MICSINSIYHSLTKRFRDSYQCTQTLKLLIYLIWICYFPISGFLSSGQVKLTTYSHCAEEDGGMRSNALWIERSSIVCQKIKAKILVIVLANHNMQTAQWANQNSKNSYNGAKRGKTLVSEARLVLICLPIGLETGASFTNQSQSLVKQQWFCA